MTDYIKILNYYVQAVLMRTFKKQSASETECPTTSLRLAILIIV